jgi:hypothetical protein
MMILAEILARKLPPYFLSVFIIFLRTFSILEIIVESFDRRKRSFFKFLDRIDP